MGRGQGRQGAAPRGDAHAAGRGEAAQRVERRGARALVGVERAKARGADPQLAEPARGTRRVQLVRGDGRGVSN